MQSLFRSDSRLRATRLERNDAAAVLFLFLAKVLAKSTKVVIELGEQFFASRTCFLDDWIFPHGHHP